MHYYPIKMKKIIISFIHSLHRWRKLHLWFLKYCLWSTQFPPANLLFLPLCFFLLLFCFSFLIVGDFFWFIFTESLLSLLYEFVYVCYVCIRERVLSQYMYRGQRAILCNQFSPPTSMWVSGVKHFCPLTYMAGSTDYFLNILYSAVHSTHWGFNIGLRCSFKMNFVNEDMHGTWSPHGAE